MWIKTDGRSLNRKNAHKKCRDNNWIILLGVQNWQNKGTSQGLWANLY